MILSKIDNDGSIDVEMNGSAEELVKEWGNITYHLCQNLSNQLGREVTIGDLSSAVVHYTSDKEG